LSAVQLVPRDKRVLVLDLQIPGEPVPWERAGRTRGGRSFTKPKTAAQQNLIGLLARERCKEPTADPVIVELDFFMGNRRRIDGDNCQKLVWDSLTGIVWDDDSQVVEWYGHKHVDKLFPRTELRVWRTVGE
jgi:Holliday junction resolvase RusA-like endonuclease